MVAFFDGFDGLLELLSQCAFAEDAEYASEHPAFEVLAIAYHDNVHTGRAVRPGTEGVRVAGVSAPGCWSR